MLDGLNTAAAGMAAQQKRLDATANDLANVNTTGYKRVRIGFQDLVYQRTGMGANEGVRTGSGTRAVDAGRGWQQGAVRETGVPTDLALQGEGFFKVRDERGNTVLTRDGALRVDDQGGLVTSNGHRLDPAIKLPAGVSSEDLRFGADGSVSAKGQALGRIEVVRVRAPQMLQANGDNTFTPTAGSGRPVAAAADGTKVMQGGLEASNVDVADTMTDLIDSQRSYQLASKAIQTSDQMWEIANGVKR